MPLTAGEWLAQEIARLGLHFSVTPIVTDQKAAASIDAYHPHDRVIQLRADTHFKRDPMHWAIAAHELGHARFRLTWPRLGRAIAASPFIKRTIIGAAIALGVGNVMFALPGITDASFALFVAAAVLHQLVLLDEAAASTLALESLRATVGIQPRHLRHARIALTLAFSTYAISFLVHLALLTQWHLVELDTATPAVPPTTTLTTLGTIAALFATLIAALSAWRRVRPPEDPTPTDTLLHFGGQLAVFGFVCLVWNHHATSTWAYFVIAALFPISHLFTLVLALPGALLDSFIFARVARRFAVDPTHRTAELERDHRAGEAARTAGNAAFAQLLQRVPSASPRVLHVLRLSYVPLVVAYWLS